jgi:hypothetical protein
MDEESVQRDNFVQYDDVYNIYIGIERELYQFDNNEYKYLAVWKQKFMSAVTS